MTSFTSPVTFPTWSFYWDIYYCHILRARAWTPALMSAPTHALSRKVLSLTKTKDKIYKTKNDNIKNILPQLYNTITLRSTLHGVLLPVRAPSVGKKEQLNHLRRMIIIGYLKLFSCVQMVWNREDYLINKIQMQNGNTWNQFNCVQINNKTR